MADTYRYLAPYYDQFSDPEGEREILTKILFWAQEHLSKRDCLLDLGCGTGRLTLPLAALFSEITAVDGSPEMLEAFRKNLAASDTPVAPRLVAGDFLTAELPGARVITCLTDTVNHLPPEHMDPFFARIEELLLPGGLFIFDILNLDYLRRERGDHTFYVELGKDPAAPPDVGFVWENQWEEAVQIATSTFTFYKRREGECYERIVTETEEFYYRIEDIAATLLPDIVPVDKLVLPERTLYLFRRHN